MNYDEMLNAREGGTQGIVELPLGALYKKKIEGKYHNVIELKPDLAEDLLFCEGLRRDQRTVKTVNHPQQLQYELWEENGVISELEFQSGNYLTLDQLLRDDPSVVARPGFMENAIKGMMELTEQLHSQGIYHLCFAQRTVFIRKSDNMPMLLWHGSSFAALKDKSVLFDDCEADVAPEVLEEGKMDERSDVFALGRFIEGLYASSSLPYELKGVVKKATDPDPDNRYPSVAAMREAMSKKRGMKRSLWTMVGALVVVGLLVFLYFDLTPESANVEFVDKKGAVQEKDPFSVEYDEPYNEEEEEYMDPEMEMYMDSMNVEPMSDDEVKRISDSLHVANDQEKIFRRRFEERAKQKIQSLYSSSNLGSSETNFISHSQQVMDELMNYATELSEQTGVPTDAGSVLASQIISNLQAQMQSGVKRYGSQTGTDSNN